jgi:predicted nucleotidyltransferase
MVQKSDKNLELVRDFKKRLEKDIKVDKVILFGSRVKGTFNQYSDFDLLVISKSFKGIPWYKRPVKIYMMWKEDYPLEVLCFTPEEVKKRMNRLGIVSEAMKEGIAV